MDSRSSRRQQLQRERMAPVAAGREGDGAGGCCLWRGPRGQCLLLLGEEPSQIELGEGQVLLLGERTQPAGAARGGEAAAAAPPGAEGKDEAGEWE